MKKTASKSNVWGIEEVRQIVTSQLEDEATPAQILAIVKTLEGKTLNARHLAAFPSGPDRWYFRKEYGMTSLTECAYRRQESPCFNFLLGHSETGVVWNAETFVSKNTCWFEGATKRNEKRHEALKPSNLAKMAETMNAIEAAKAAFNEAKAAFVDLTEYDAPFSPDDHSFRETLMGKAARNEMYNSYNVLSL